MQHTNLSNKKIVVTGGGGRLGSRMVTRFSELGADVIALVHSLPDPGDSPWAGAPVTARQVDATRETSVMACFKAISDETGPIDALVHTVGMWAGSPLLTTSVDDWETILRMNLTSAFLCFREAIRIMNPVGGTLIGIASRQGADSGVKEQAAYSASKAGVVRLVESAAKELSHRHIHCHAIAPSTILFNGEGDGVQAEDVVATAAWLIERGRALTGATIRTYGD